MSIEKEKKWYIIKSQSNREKNIYERIKTELKKETLFGKVEKVLLPTQEIYNFRNGKKIKREKPMFPGYVFVQSSDISSLKEFIKKTSGYSGFLTSKSGEIQSISEEEINKMLGIKEDIEKESMFKVGEKINIIDGPFTNMKAIIDEIMGQNVKVSVFIFDKKTSLELYINQISKI